MTASGTNPFLMGGAFETNAVSNSVAAAAEYNPFGVNAGTEAANVAATSFSSNPFLAGFAGDGGGGGIVEPAGTNPFAQFFSNEATTTRNVFASNQATQPQPPPPPRPFEAFPMATAAEKRSSLASSNVSDLLGDFNEPPAPAPTPYSATNSASQSINTSPVDKNERATPRRPPPPRPMPPRESKELILSVTAALEQTSTDLLDRLQATRTPSPTPLRELNSPSPTLMGEVNDLLGDEIDMPKFSHGEAAKHTKHDIQQEALNLFDAIASLSKQEEHKESTTTTASASASVSANPLAVAPPLPPSPSPSPPPPPPPPPAPATATASAPVHSLPSAPPTRPPPPPLPMHCESDLRNLTAASEFETASQRYPITRTDSRDTPQTSRKSSLVSSTSSRKSSADHRRDRDVDSPTVVVAARDDGGLPQPPQIIAETVESSNAGLMERKDVNYVAMRKASHDVTASRAQIMPTHKKYSLDYSSGLLADQNVIKEKFEQYAAVADTDRERYAHGNAYAAAAAAADDDDNNKILEAPKFAVISTTPIMSCENINSETLYDTEREPSLIFDEATVTAAVHEGQGRSEKVDPFASFVQNESRPTPDPFVSYSSNVGDDVSSDPFAAAFTQPVPSTPPLADDFDAFQEKFDNVKQPSAGDAFDPFAAASGIPNNVPDESHAAHGFGNEDAFDEFLAMNQPPATFDAKFDQTNQYIEASWPDTNDQQQCATETFTYTPQTQPPSNFGEAFNAAVSQKVAKTDSTETPPTPLFDEDVSQPLEPFPRTNYDGPGWEMQIRYPIRKKFTGQRFWKKVFVRLVYQGETPHLELVNKDDGKETLHHEWPLQPCYAISDIGAQQYDQYGKIFTIKIQFVVYKERPGVRPGQVTKAERLTNKLSQFAAYAIQGDYQGVKEFGSDLKKLGLPVEHSPQISLICKLGSHNYEDMKRFSACVEDALFRLSAHRDNIHINYKMEEVQITAVDELYVEQNSHGSIDRQIARVRLFFLGFLTGMPDVEIGVNDLRRQGKEVVGRHDIIPVVTEEWIRLENVEFHSCIQQDVYEETKTIKLKPPDACYLELMRFRVRPPKNRELPLQLKTTFRICGNKVDILADILVPGFTSRKLGQIPCEDVAVRIPIPECWIYLFRTEKHFRYGSVKSAHRRTGKIKGIERFLGAVDTLEPHLIEVTSGHAKYEHHHKSIVWRMSRLPKEGQGAYTTHNLICHLQLTSYDQIPEELAKYCYVEFTMPITQVSHTTVRSVSISNSDSDTPPEKYVRHLARHEYRVEIEQTHAESTSDYIAATMTKPPPTARSAVVSTAAAATAPPPSIDPEPASDSDSE